MFESVDHCITVPYQQHSRVNATGVTSAMSRFFENRNRALSHVFEVEALPRDPSGESFALVLSCRHMAGSCTTTRRMLG